MEHKYLLRAWSTALALTAAVILGAGCGGGKHTETPGDDNGTVDDGTGTASDELAMEGEALVGVADGKFGDPAVEAKIEAVGTILSANSTGSFYQVALKPFLRIEDASAQLTSSDIVYVEPNWQAHTLAASNDSYWATQYAATVKGEVEAAWGAWSVGAGVTSGAPIVVAVVDTGVQTSHPDLSAKVLAPAAFDNAVAGAADTTDVSDADGHGTQVAGVVAAQINNGAGVAGIAAWASGADTAVVKVLPIKVSDATHIANHASIARGINQGVARGAHVILVSLGSGAPSWTLQKAIENAWANNILVVAAAGNSASSLMKYPAAYQGTKQNVLSVASVDASDALSADSNYGSWVNIAAPGERIISTDIAGAYTNLSTKSGTSFSAAFVAGAAGLVWSKYPPAATTTSTKLTAAELRKVLIQSVDSASFGKKPLAAAAGRLNVQAAMVNAANAASASPLVIPASVVFSAPTVVSGGSLTGTVVLTGAVPSGTPLDVTLALTGSDAATATLSASKVTIPAGSSTGTFKLTATSVAAVASPVVTATVTINSTPHVASATVQVQPPGISSITLDKRSAVGGTTLNATVTFNAAPASDTPVTIDTTDHAAIPVPTGVKVSAKATSVKFSLPTSAVAVTSSDIDVSATVGTVTVHWLVTITSPGVASVAFTPSSTIVWNTPGTTGAVTGTVTLNGKAAVDTTVTLTPNDSGITAPATATVLAGATTGTFTVQPEPVAVSTSFSVIATIGAYNATSNPGKAGTFKVGPALTGFSVSPTAVSGAGTVTATATLAAVAPSNQTIPVTVDSTICNATSPLPGAAVLYFAGPSCSGNITIVSGQKTGTVQLLTRAAMVPTVAPVTASLLGVDKTSNVTASAPTLSSITLAAKSVSVGNSIAGTVTLSGAAVASTTVDLSIKSGGLAIIKVSNDNATWDGSRNTVTFGVGETTKAFYVQGVAAGSDTVNAKVTGTTSIKSVAVSTVASTGLVAAITGGAVNVVGGLQTAAGTVTITPAPTADTVVTLTPSDPAITGTTVTVTKNTTSKSFTLYVPPRTGSASTAALTVDASLASGEHATATGSVTVNPTISAVLPVAVTLHTGTVNAASAPNKVTLGTSNLTGVAIPVAVSLVQADGATACPTGVAGGTLALDASAMTVATSAIDTGAVNTFTVTDTYVGATSIICKVKATATVGGVAVTRYSGDITLGNSGLAVALTVSPVTTVMGGYGVVSGTVSLAANAVGAKVVTLTTSNAAVSGTTVTIADGASSHAFTLAVPARASAQAGVTVTATIPSTETKTSTDTVTVDATTIASVNLAPATIALGGTSTVTVTLGAINNSGGPLTIDLSSGTLATATLPPSTQVTVLNGSAVSDSATLTAVAAGTTSITASLTALPSATASATLTVDYLTVPLTVGNGATVQGDVTLGAAVAGSAVHVALTKSCTAPADVTLGADYDIAIGDTGSTAPFDIIWVAGDGAATCTITATVGGTAYSRVITPGS